MTCRAPWKMYWNGEYTPNHKRDLKPYRRSNSDIEVLIPCGRCVSCKLNYSSLWATRCMCEAKEHEHNYFMTLTYDDDHLEDNYGCVGSDLLYGAPSIHMEHISQFNKNLRNYYKRKFGLSGIRFLASGEYSPAYRPHYHAIYFNLDIPDLEYYKQNEYGDPLYTSELINSIWQKGYVVIGELTYESAQYVAKYVLKPETLPKEYYDYFNIDPEGIRMSRRPGIGIEWFKKHKFEVMRDNGVYIEGKLKPIPRYWIERITMDSEEAWFRDMNDYYSEVEGKAMKAIRKRLTDKTLDEQLDEARRRPFDEDIQKRKDF